MKGQIKYSLSAGNWGDGKSVCLWRTTGTGSVKIARFQSDDAAKMFAEEFDFPLSDAMQSRLKGPESP